MKATTVYLLFIFSVFFLATNAQQKEPVDYADPLLGTSESRWMLNPGATMPFGMLQLSPDNQGGVWKSGYEYTVNSIGGFSHIHSWTMNGLSVMPTVGALNTHRGPADGPTTGWTSGYRSRIDKTTEVASPGYYAVTLPGKTFVIEAKNTSNVNRYIQSAKLDGEVIIYAKYKTI